MNLRPVLPVSNENDQPSEKPGFYVETGETDTSTPQIYKRGWKKSVSAEKAIKDTLAEVAKLFPGQKVFGDPEIIETDEHKKANEYLVKVLVL